MLVEMRTYVLHAGQLATFLGCMEREGLAIERPILGQLLGYYSSEIGTLNQVIHLWGFDSFEERTRRRQRLADDPAWQRFVPTVTPFIRDMRNQLLTPAPFAPVATLDGSGTQIA
jgi:hypothetical protein